MGLPGPAFRTGNYFVCNNIDSDPRMEPWRENALIRGYRSVIAFPIKFLGLTCGVFALYAPTTDFFDNEEIRLLNEVTSDLSFSLEVLYTQKQKDILVNEFQESERKLATLIGNLPGMVYRCKNDPYWTMEYVSEGCHELTGYKPPELTGNQCISYNQLIAESFRDKIRNKWQKKLQKKEVFQDEYPIINANGKLKWVWEQGCGIFTPDGKIDCIGRFCCGYHRTKNNRKSFDGK